jgi:hypothetical protein
MFNRGIIPRPSETWPEISQDCTFQMFDGDSTSKGVNVRDNQLNISGTICIDGSCGQHPIRGIKRASWGLVVIDAAGKVQAAARGIVPACLPQTSQSGEYSAMVCVAALATGPCRILSDCANVVRDWTKRKCSQLHFERAYGGLLETARSSDDQENIQDVQWVKAHQSIQAARDAGNTEALANALGNEATALQAKEGRKLHKQPRKEQSDELRHQYRAALTACKVIAAVLPFWPRLARSGERSQTGRKPRPAWELQLRM